MAKSKFEERRRIARRKDKASYLDVCAKIGDLVAFAVELGARQDLKVGLNFDKKRLGEVLVAVAKSKAAPEFNIDFTVKDVNAVKDELFARCATNARAIANGLCAGAGCRLGEILSINYSWDEIDIHMGSCTCAAEADGCSAPDIDPDDIDVSDSVTFVWSIC